MPMADPLPVATQSAAPFLFIAVALPPTFSRPLLLRLQEVRERRDDAFGKIQSRFRQRWKDIKGGPHVVIHLPSVSLANKDLLEGQSHWETRQNLHMTRLTDLMDDNVDVVYICPHDNVPDMDAYWSKLLQIGGVQNPGARFRIIVPENASILPAHMSLTSKLIFSPKALARIKFFVGSRPAYIVPGSLGKEDIDLSVALGFPILGPHPMRAIGLKMRSRRRKILRTSQVTHRRRTGIDVALEMLHTHLLPFCLAVTDVDVSTPGAGLFTLCWKNGVDYLLRSTRRRESN